MNMNKEILKLSDLSVNDFFRFLNYKDLPSGPLNRVVGREFTTVTFVSVDDLFSPIYNAIDYCHVIKY